jgi:penicillin-binding protein 1A
MHHKTIELQPMHTDAQNKDVLLSELTDAYQHIKGQHSFLKTTGSVFVAVVTIALGILTLNTSFITFIVGNQNNFLLCYAVFVVILLLFLLYIIDAYKEVVVYSRKAIVVRRLLGVEYGNYSYPIPNWSVVGADNPFAIRMFPGWGPKQSISILFWTVTILALVPLVFYKALYPLTAWGMMSVAFVAILALFCFLFRTRLYDRHESLLLSVGLTIAKMFRLPVSRNIEQDLYMAKLSYSEVVRNKGDDEPLKKLIVAIEDARFYTHKGVVVKSLLRGIASSVPLLRRRYGIIISGGSTIEMQLARTLFIKDFSKQYRRKVVEVILAKWLFRLSKKEMLSKDDLLNIYVSAVQYGPRVIGFLSAKIHYFNDVEHQLTDDDRVLLVDRLSSIQTVPRTERITYIAKRARAIGLNPKK